MLQGEQFILARDRRNIVADRGYRSEQGEVVIPFFIEGLGCTRQTSPPVPGAA